MEKWQCPCFLGTDDEGDTHWYGYTFDDLISAKKVREDLDYEDLFAMEGRDSEGNFSFLQERIDVLNIGEAFKDNSYLIEDNPSDELKYLLENTLDNEYSPIGICFAEELSRDYGDYVWRPLVLENNKGERIWIHIPYTKWLNWTSLQKK